MKFKKTFEQLNEEERELVEKIYGGLLYAECEVEYDGHHLYIANLNLNRMAKLWQKNRLAKVRKQK